MTRLQYALIDDTSTRAYGSTVTQPRWLDDRQQRVWQAYLHLNQHLYAFLEQQLVGGGLSGPDYRVLHPLSEAPGGLLRARELCAEIGWDRSRLSHHISRSGAAIPGSSAEWSTRTSLSHRAAFG